MTRRGKRKPAPGGVGWTAWSRLAPRMEDDRRLGNVAIPHVPLHHGTGAWVTPSGIGVRFDTATGWEFCWPTSGPTLDERLDADELILRATGAWEEAG